MLGWTGSRQYLRFLRQHAVDLGMNLNSHRQGLHRLAQIAYRLWVSLGNGSYGPVSFLGCDADAHRSATEAMVQLCIASPCRLMQERTAVEPLCMVSPANGQARHIHQ